MTEHHTIVGIDPSLTSTGIAVIHHPGQFGARPVRSAPYPLPEGGRSVELRRVQSKGKASASWDERGDRLRLLVGGIIDAVPTRSLVLMEAPAYGAKGTGQFDRAGLWWAIHTELRWVLGCRVVPVTPPQRAKYATGAGNADKDRVLAAVIRRYPSVEVTGNDEADALVIAAMGARLTGHPIDGDMPAAHLAALDKLQAEFRD